MPVERQDRKELVLLLWRDLSLELTEADVAAVQEQLDRLN